MISEGASIICTSIKLKRDFNENNAWFDSELWKNIKIFHSRFYILEFKSYTYVPNKENDIKHLKTPTGGSIYSRTWIRETETDGNVFSLGGFSQTT